MAMGKKMSPKTVLMIMALLALTKGTLAQISPSDVIIYDPLDGSTTGTLVGNPPPAFVPGVFGLGAQPLPGSLGAAIEYAPQPPASGTLMFWVKVAAPIVFYAGPDIGFWGHELGDCDDFYGQIGPNPSALEVAIDSSAGGTSASGDFPQVLNWQPGEVHHLALTWGDGVNTFFYIDGVQMSLGSTPFGPYVPASCIGSSTPPLLFTASRVTAENANSYSPGHFVFDDFALLGRPLTALEVAQAYDSRQPLRFSFEAELLKTTVLSQINALQASANKHDQAELHDASVYLSKALDPALWQGTDGNHLNPKRALEEFLEEGIAAFDLMELLNEPHSSIPAQTVLPLLNDLVQADRILATVATADAAGGNAQVLAKANAQVALGDSAAAGGKYIQAIANYAFAWALAHQAT